MDCVGAMVRKVRVEAVPSRRKPSTVKRMEAEESEGVRASTSALDAEVRAMLHDEGVTTRRAEG